MDQTLSDRSSLNGLVFYDRLESPLAGMDRSLMYAVPHLEPLGIRLDFITAQTLARSAKQLFKLVGGGKARGFDFFLFNSLAVFDPLDSPWGMRFLSLAARLGKPVFVYWHETEWAFRRVVGRGLGLERLKSLLARNHVYHLAASTACAEYIQQQFPHAAGYNTIFECANVTVPARMPSPVDAPIVLTISSIQERKGIDLFVETVTRVCRANEKVRFIWLGSGPDLARWQEECRERNLSDRVLFAGYVAKPEALLGLASAFFLPSRDDPFPLSVLEAMAFERSIVTFDVGGAPEALDGNGYLVPPFDTAAAADTLLDLLGKPKQELIKPVLGTRFLQEYTPQAYAARCARVLNLMLH